MILAHKMGCVCESVWCMCKETYQTLPGCPGRRLRVIFPGDVCSALTTGCPRLSPWVWGTLRPHRPGFTPVPSVSPQGTWPPLGWDPCWPGKAECASEVPWKEPHSGRDRNGGLGRGTWEPVLEASGPRGRKGLATAAGLLSGVNSTAWCEREVGRAVPGNRPLLFCLCTPCTPSRTFCLLLHARFAGDKSEALELRTGSGETGAGVQVTGAWSGAQTAPGRGGAHSESQG